MGRPCGKTKTYQSDNKASKLSVNACDVCLESLLRKWKGRDALKAGLRKSVMQLE
jgi:hypothetical protein